MKKILALICALCMIFALAACAKTDAPATNTDSTPTDSTASTDSTATTDTTEDNQTEAAKGDFSANVKIMYNNLRKLKRA